VWKVLQLQLYPNSEIITPPQTYVQLLSQETEVFKKNILLQFNLFVGNLSKLGDKSIAHEIALGLSPSEIYAINDLYPAFLVELRAKFKSTTSKIVLLGFIKRFVKDNATVEHGYSVQDLADQVGTKEFEETFPEPDEAREPEIPFDSKVTQGVNATRDTLKRNAEEKIAFETLTKARERRKIP
jgi:hypothetical protein